jgi:Cu/Ag efflux protein CusF
MQKRIALAALLLAGALACPAWAQGRPSAGRPSAGQVSTPPAVRAATPATASATAEVVEGEIVAVDAPNHRIKIKHGEIKSLNMAPISAMPYTFNDDAMLAKLKPGSKIRFTTAKVDGEVVSADAQTRRVKIKHGEIKSLNMAPMNAMPYTVTDDVMFAKLKPGSKIRFTTAKVDGTYVLLSVEEVK